MYLLDKGGTPLHCKELGTFDAMLDIVCEGQAVLYRGRELVVVQIYFSNAFESIGHWYYF